MSEITTTDVMEGKNKADLKKLLKRVRLLLSKEASISAKKVVNGTVPSVKIQVFTNAFQKIGSESILL